MYLEKARTTYNLKRRKYYASTTVVTIKHAHFLNITKHLFITNQLHLYDGFAVVNSFIVNKQAKKNPRRAVYISVFSLPQS
jgi:uncharacterized membrane protein (GlpM family)